jgi:hypothetical protein
MHKLKKAATNVHVDEIFCDLAKAFDCVNHDILLTKLYFIGIQGTKLSWFRSCLTDIRQKTEIKSSNSMQKYLLKLGINKTWSSTGVNFRAFAS